jgi:ABC-2 type transport system ATP-binding protein
MIFDGVDRNLLEPFGKLATPTLSDLFVALMQRPTANPGSAQ